MQAAIPNGRGNAGPHHDSIWSAGVRAAALSALANAVVVVAAVIAGVFPRLHILPFAGSGFGLGSVVLISAAGALGGTALFSLLWHRAERPMQVFALLVSCVLLVSFAAPMFAANWTFMRLSVMELTHLVVAGVTLFALWRWMRAEIHYHQMR